MKAKQTFSLLLLAVAMFGIIGATAVEAGSYDRNAASKFAVDNALIKVSNSDFYLKNGGDCTNFVSNALKAGGWPQVGKYNYASYNSWYFESTWPTRYSRTWGGANNFYGFLYYSNRVSWVSGPSQLQIGDIVQMDGLGSSKPDNTWDHTMMVTGRNGNELLFSYHSDTVAGFKKNEGMNAIVGRNPNAIFMGWHVKDTY
ncbi:MAG: amidase domain-containing protein [Minisyncoccia bacterium]